MSKPNEINVRELLDSRGVGSYQKFIIALCFLVVVMDGFDVVIMGFVGPALKDAWHWTNSDLAPVLSAALYTRFSSRGTADFANRVQSAMRHEFGGHVEKPADDVPARS